MIIRKVLHVITGMDAKYGGATVTLPELALATQQTGRYQNAILDFPKKDEQPLYVHGASLEYFTMDRSWKFGLSSAFERRLREILEGVDIVQTHGLWKGHNTFVGLKARARGLPFIVSTHGMLEPWALRNKGWKKYPYYYVVERRFLARASCLRALTLAELQDFRSIGLKVPIAIIPNGVNIPVFPSPEIFLHKHNIPRDQRLILFLGRIHPKKGVDILCNAWSRIARMHSDTHLVIAGPGQEADVNKIRALVQHLSISSRVSMTGLIGGDVKLSALAAAHCFVLPSHSEGFSVAVLEALAAGLPALVSPACNQSEVADYQCGMIINPSAGELAETLDHFLRLPSEDVVRMRTQARVLAGKYSWDTIGTKMADVYDWLLDGPKPDGFVYV